jgi:hypothetical protein
MPGDSSPSQAPRQQFLFVDVNDSQQTPKVKTQIRSHLMHTAFQQRRIQRTQFLNPTTPFPTPSVSTTPNEISISEAGPITTSSVTGSKAPSHPHSRKKQPKAHDVSPPSRRRGETSSAEATGGLASPLSVLSTSVEILSPHVP